MPNITIRKWLIINSYGDIEILIDKVMDIWKIKGAKTRRNWWEVLAGGKNGKPRIIEGIYFPVLKAAQIREHVNITQNAICRNENEEIPKKKINGRWDKNKRR